MEITQASQKVLQEHYQYLESSLDAQALSGALFSKGLITLELNEELALFHTTRTQKNGILLRYLLRNSSPNLIPQLCEILSAEEANRYIARELEGKSQSPNSTCTSIYLTVAIFVESFKKMINHTVIAQPSDGNGMFNS